MWVDKKTAIAHDNKVNRRKIEYVPATSASGKFGSKVNGTKGPNTPQTPPEKKSKDDEVSGPKPGLFPPEIVEKHLKWNAPRRVAPGLYNAGNTCFLNSTLQCLLHVPAASQIILHEEKLLQNIFRKSNDQHSILLLYSKLVKEVWSKDAPKSISPRGMVQTIRKVGKQFRPMRQEDAHEYLRQLIDCMHEEQLKSGHMKFSTHGKLCETTLMSRLFGGYFRNELRCSSCGYVSRTYNQFLDLSLEVMKNVSSVTDALNGFQRKEVLGKGNEWKCEKCNKKVQATKQMTIHVAPATLVLHLKRFSFGGMFSKVNKHISFEATLQVKTSSESVPIPYDLCGIVVHHGSSVHSGHYVAYVKGAGGQWCCMNDNLVSTTSIKQVLQEQAYILFYTKKSAPQTQPVVAYTPVPPVVPIPAPVTPPVNVAAPAIASPKITEPEPMEVAADQRSDDSPRATRLKPRHHFWQPLFRFAGRLNKLRLWRPHHKSLEQPLREGHSTTGEQEAHVGSVSTGDTMSHLPAEEKRANEEAVSSFLSELDDIVQSKPKRAGVTVFKEATDKAVSREDLLKLSYRGRDVGTEGYWDDIGTNVTDKLVAVNKQQRKAERETMNKRQLDDWDKALDSGRVKKVKAKTVEDESLAGRNFFQEVQDRKSTQNGHHASLNRHDGTNEKKKHGKKHHSNNSNRVVH